MASPDPGAHECCPSASHPRSVHEPPNKAQQPRAEPGPQELSWQLNEGPLPMTDSNPRLFQAAAPGRQLFLPCHIASTASPPAMSSILASWSSLAPTHPEQSQLKRIWLFAQLPLLCLSPQGIPEHGKTFPTGRACKKQKLNEPRCSSQGAMPTQSSPAWSCATAK